MEDTPVPESTTPTATPPAAQRGPKPDLIRGYLAASVQTRETFLRDWKDSVNYRVQRPFGGDTDPATASSDRIAVPEDWARTRQKTAQLSFTIPKVLMTAKRPEFMPSEVAATARLNDVLSRECRFSYQLDECLSDVINAAGIMVCLVDVDQRYENVTLPAPPPSFDPATGQPVPAPPPQTVQRKIYQSYFAKRVSPASFLWPSEFTGSDWDDAPWLGCETYVPLEDAKKRWKIPADHKGSEAKPALLSEDIGPKTTSGEDTCYCKVQQVWIKASAYDPEIPHPEAIWKMTFVDGISEPVENGPCDRQTWVEPTAEVPPNPGRPAGLDPMTGQPTPAVPPSPGTPAVPGHFLGLRRFPIRVATLVYVSDLAIPPSDSAAGRPQVREGMRFRTQMLRQRDHSSPMRWYDVNRLDEEVIERIRNGDVQDMIPVNGPGDRVIGEVARASYPRESYEGAQRIAMDLDRSWALSSNQLNGTNAGGRSATEIQTMSSANELRLDYEKERVHRFVAEVAEVLFSLMQVFEDQTSYVSIVGENGVAALQAVNASTLAGDYLFTIKADSSERVDTKTKVENALKAWNLLANSPSTNRANLEREIWELLGFDPQKMQQKPVEKGPDSANISFRFSGEDMTNPVAIAVMLKAGYDIGPSDITAAQNLIHDAVQGMPANNPALQPGHMAGKQPTAPGASPRPEVTPPDTPSPILKRLESGARMSP